MAQMMGSQSGHSQPNGFGDPRWTQELWDETTPYRTSSGHPCRCFCSKQPCHWSDRENMIVCEWHFSGCPGGVKEVVVVTDEGDDDSIELDWAKIPM